MSIWLILLPVLALPCLALLVFVALSCLRGSRLRSTHNRAQSDNHRTQTGDGASNSFSDITFNPRHGVYDTTYFRSIANAAAGSGSEQIEMESMLAARDMDR